MEILFIVIEYLEKKEVRVSFESDILVIFFKDKNILQPFSKNDSTNKFKISFSYFLSVYYFINREIKTNYFEYYG